MGWINKPNSNHRMTRQPLATDYKVSEMPQVIIHTPSLMHSDYKGKIEYHGIEESKFPKDTKWNMFYKFPYVIACRHFCRAKIYLTGATTSICSYSLASKFIPVLTPLELPTMALFVTVTGLYLISNTFRRIICHAYATDDNKYVRLSKLTLFANRQDLILPTSLVVPLTENNANFKSLALKLLLKRPEKIDLSYDTYDFYDEQFFFPVRYGESGGVLDEDRFKVIFGNIFSKKS